ncbi:MAG: amidohydrolase family protein, partial [Polyangiaceae bacterium]|nr:amidohydrolase family protein [Polyangiaceae bacterium]
MLPTMRFLGTLSVSLLLLPIVASSCSSDPGTTDKPDSGKKEETSVPLGKSQLQRNSNVKVTECSTTIAPSSSGTCTVKAGSGVRVLQGTVLLPNETLHKGEVVVSEQGTIVCAACDCSDAPGYNGATQVACADGVISPGLVNPHEHITYANNPPIGHGEERYEHRHDWRKGTRGHTAIPYKSGASKDVVRYGELRYLMSGATSLAGAGGEKGFLRNVDDNDTSLFEGLAITPADSDTFPLGDTGGKLLASGCEYGNSKTTSSSIKDLDGYLPHIAEGIDNEARNELTCTSKDDSAAGRNDLFQKQTAVIHAVAVGPEEAALFRADQTAVIWSPRSNVDLYGNTSPVTLLDVSGVQIALGTDWIPSGSMNMFRELQCADGLNKKYYDQRFSDSDLWKMVTENAAFAVGGKNSIGMLKPGYVADIAIYNGKTNKDHRAIIDGGVEDTVLVLRGGVPLYGDTAVMDALGADTCESMGEVCGTEKKVCAQKDTGATLAQIRTAGEAIYPLFFCRGEVPKSEPSCTPWREQYPDGITDNDSDGDGIKNDDDNCPTVFNPVRGMDNGKQGDSDADGIGDVCDKCPTDFSNNCSAPLGNDLDGDGIANGDDNCPEDSNADQADKDKDGKGDVCDSCATANPGSTACASTVLAIRDPMNPNHPKSGSSVTLTDLYVT